MVTSLDKPAELPDFTRCCCANGHRLSKLRFTLAAKPQTVDLTSCEQRSHRLLSQGQPTLPSSIKQDILINLFLRMRQAPVAPTIRRFDPSDLDDDTEVFAALRQWKNQFK